MQPGANGRGNHRPHRPFRRLALRIGRDTRPCLFRQTATFLVQEHREAPVPDREHPAGVMIRPLRALFLGLEVQDPPRGVVACDHIPRLAGRGVKEPQHHVGPGLVLTGQQRRERIHRIDQDVRKAEHHPCITNEGHCLRQRERRPPRQPGLQIGKPQTQPAAVAVVVGNVPLARPRDEEHLLGARQPHPLQQVLRHRPGLAVGALAGMGEAHRHQLLAERQRCKPCPPPGRRNQPHQPRTRKALHGRGRPCPRSGVRAAVSGIRAAVSGIKAAVSGVRDAVSGHRCFHIDTKDALLK